MDKKYTKNCPKCGKIQKYSTKKILLVAIKKKRQCRECSNEERRYSPEEKKLKKRINDKKYRESNKEKLSKLKKIYRDKNKEKIKEYMKEYRQTGKYLKKRKRYNDKYNSKERTQKKRKEYRKIYNQREKIKKRRRVREKEERKCPLVRIGHSVSASMRGSLKAKNLSKNKRHWEDIVGYTVQELKEHLEKLFQQGMNWNNYGEWHIDHIIPQSFFKYNSINDVEFKYCWSLHNLQPLWAEDNLIKADKIKGQR